jgi:hypothetical protein
MKRNYNAPRLTTVGEALAVVLHVNGAKNSPGGDGQCNPDQSNCSLHEVDD